MRPSTMTPKNRMQPPPDELPDDDSAEDDRLLRIRERPDGYHWVDVEGRQEFGPFDSVEDALADMEGASEESIEQADLDEAAEQGIDIDSQVDRRDEDDPEGVT